MTSEEKAQEIIDKIKCGRLDKPTALSFIEDLIDMEKEYDDIMYREFSVKMTEYWPPVKEIVTQYQPITS